MHVKPRDAETIKTRKPKSPEKIKTRAESKIKIPTDSLLYFILVMCLDANFAMKIVRKNAIIPAMKMTARIVIKSVKFKLDISLPTATAEPVLPLPIT